MKAQKNKLISRNIDTEQIHLREADENGERYIEGYAIVFNQRSKLIREWGQTFFEIIAPEAVDKVLRSPDLNTIATIDHWREKMLGRTKSGTLELIKDAKGLMYRIKVPNTTLGNDIAEMIARGDYFESSFIFTIADMREEKSDDVTVRTVLEIERLIDVSIVIDGAYANTAVQLRSQEWETAETSPEPVEGVEGEREEKENPALDILKRKVAIHKLNS